jgi:hypothetical protein
VKRVQKGRRGWVDRADVRKGPGPHGGRYCFGLAPGLRIDREQVGEVGATQNLLEIVWIKFAQHRSLCLHLEEPSSKTTAASKRICFEHNKHNLSKKAE